MDRIYIKGLSVYAHHGVKEQEKQLGQRFVVNAVLFADTRQAGLSDDLGLTVNYSKVSKDITAFMTENTYDLIEAAAEHLAEHLLLAYDGLHGVDIEIMKPWAPVGLPVDTVSVRIERSWHEAFLSFGSNLGDRQAHIDAGLDALRADRRIRLHEVSQVVQTAPYGPVQQGDFLNGCARLETLYTPCELLSVLMETERSQGRQRTVHWGPRTLDLDILFFDDLVTDRPELVIPHPDMENRAFVLEPLAQIAPYKVHPLSGKRVCDMLKDLKDM